MEAIHRNLEEKILNHFHGHLLTEGVGLLKIDAFVLSLKDIVFFE